MQIDKKYYPELDSLRAFAVLSVMIAHFNWNINNKINLFFEWGFSGVLFFFVLSGFLITRILIASKGKEIKKQLKIFYLRRTLRIFPIYYFVILVFFILGFEPIRKDLFWFLTYTSNFKQAFGDYSHWWAAHLWSLAVEEQFYLLWPIFVLIFNLDKLIKICIAGILFSIFFRFAISYFNLGFSMATRPIFGSLDSLLIGSLMALFFCNKKNDMKFKAQDLIQTKTPKIFNYFKHKQVFNILLLLSLIFVIFINLLRFSGQNGEKFNDSIMFSTFYPLFFSIVSLYIIYVSIEQKYFLLNKILSQKWLMYIGKISYGMYVYHFFLNWILPKILAKLSSSTYYFMFTSENSQKNQFLPSLTYFILATTITVALSALSWELFEKKINAQKNRLSAKIS